VKRKRGRPPIPNSEHRVSIEITLAPDVIERLTWVGNRSAYIEQLIRRDLARRPKRGIG